jgi:hypothetical protein
MEGFCGQPATKVIAMNMPETTAYRMQSVHSTRRSTTSTDRAQGLAEFMDGLSPLQSYPPAPDGTTGAGEPRRPLAVGSPI